MEMGDLPCREVKPHTAVNRLFSQHGGGQQGRKRGAQATIGHDSCLKGKTMAKEDQERAEARFHMTIKKAQEAKQAVSQYEADARAVGEKTAKLRALRLAKEAAEA